MTNPAPWPADHVERRPTDSLIAYARNSRTHSPEQVNQISASIREFGFANPVLIDEAGTIIAGHGRVLAAQKLKLPDVPVMVARGWTDAQKRAYVIADNKLALNAGWDTDLLRSELEDLTAAEFNLPLLGFSDGELNDLLATPEEPRYSRKIQAPIYEPKGEKPTPTQLYDRKKTAALLHEINLADIPEDVAAFLRIAAERHTVIDFQKVAEFYAHADAPTQRLMEASALVIIDFHQAIEAGYVKLTKRLGHLAAQESADA